MWIETFWLHLCSGVSWLNHWLETFETLSLCSINSISRRAMAFKPGTSLVKCYECETEGKFFRMYQSFRPTHAWTDEEGRTKAVLFCVDCELKNRIKEWESFSEEEKGVAGEGYATLDAVRKDQKNRSREGWAARSEPIKGAKAALKALKESWSEEVVQVNFMQCMQNMELEDKKDEEEKGDQESSPGASNDGPVVGPECKKQRTSLPVARSDDKLMEVARTRN